MVVIALRNCTICSCDQAGIFGYKKVVCVHLRSHTHMEDSHNTQTKKIYLTQKLFIEKGLWPHIYFIIN